MTSQDRPDVLLVVSDQHNFRFVSHRDPDAGGEPVSTPTLDGLDEAGVRFENAYSPVPICGPVRQCLLTGRRAVEAGGWTNRSVLKPGLPTLPGTLSDAGYTTALVGKMHLSGTRQFAGFDHRPYGDLTGHTGHQYEDEHAHPNHPDGWRSLLGETGVTDIPESLLQESNAVDETVAFLREHAHRRPETPWFTCVSLSRPHWPRTAPRRFLDRYWPEGVTPPKVEYDPAETPHALAEDNRARYAVEEVPEADRRRARAAYMACVDFVDEFVGDLLATLERDGLLDDAVVVYASDHGDMAGEHGLWEKLIWYDGASRIPWLAQLPGHRSGELAPATVETPVSLVDLFPTVCGLAGVDPPAGLVGHDLSATLASGAEPDRGPVVSDNLAVGERAHHYRMVRDGRYKYVGFADAPELLYDLETDPFEERNLAVEPGEHRDALERLRAFVEDTMDFEAAWEQRERDAALEERYRLGTPTGTGNAYQLPGGRVVDADTPLYHPHVLVEAPEAVYDDFPADAD